MVGCITSPTIVRPITSFWRHHSRFLQRSQRQGRWKTTNPKDRGVKDRLEGIGKSTQHGLGEKEYELNRVCHFFHWKENSSTRFLCSSISRGGLVLSKVAEQHPPVFDYGCPKLA
mmetsp:Transcript_5708/g.19964  ORF Transcript_5708/g.19964 Transcript_5708/m.19964 type:complete len:115 (-) Transcript_5708:1064-1408(-)